MKNRYWCLSIVMICIGLVACDIREESFEVLHSETLIDSILTRMPGDLMIKDSIALMTDPFNKKKVIQVFNLKQGRFIDSYIRKGKGPEELISPSLEQVFHQTAVIYDVNLNKLAFLDLNAISDTSVTIKSLPSKNKPVKVIQYKEDHFIGVVNEKGHPFELFNTSRSLGYAGHYPVKGRFNNAKRVLTGKVQFDTNRQLLAYSTNKIGYVSLYKISNDTLNCMWENNYAKPRYTASKNKLKWDKNQERGPIEISITKDYVVCLVVDGADQSYRFSSEKEAPDELIIFDILDGSIQRKIKLDTKVFRIYSESHNNVLYSIAIDGEFKLKKYQLDKSYEPFE